MALSSIQQFEQLFKQEYALLVSHASILLADRAMAEDVVQSVFIRLWNDDLFQTLHNPKAYLYRAVRNACLDVLKGCRRKPRISLDSMSRLSSSTHFEMADELDESQKRERDLMQLEEIVSKLPPKCKQIFDLVCIQGYSYADAAKRMSISANMIKKQLIKAYRIVRENFKFDV